MCEYCEYPFKSFKGIYADYFGYGLDKEGDLCLLIEVDFGYEGMEEACQVGPSSGIGFCMFCGRAFADGENYAEERDLAAAARYEEGILVADFDNGEHIERPFLYLFKPLVNGNWTSPADIQAFADDSSMYSHVAEATPVALKAIDQDDVEWDAVWLPSTDYGRSKEYKSKPVFYFTDEVFWA